MYPHKCQLFEFPVAFHSQDLLPGGVVAPAAKASRLVNEQHPVTLSVPYRKRGECVRIAVLPVHGCQVNISKLIHIMHQERLTVKETLCPVQPPCRVKQFITLI